MQIEALLTKTAERFLVGREKELSLLQSWIFGSEWALVHVNGHGGVGRTAFVDVFCKRFFPDNTSIYLHERFENETCFVQRIAEKLRKLGVNTSSQSEEVISHLNELGHKHRRILLVIDSFDEQKPIENWLRETWIPMLSTRVLIITIGRKKLGKEWTHSIQWCHLIRNMTLEWLDRHSIYRYMSLRGITNRELQIAIEHFSCGFPLALYIACNHALENGWNETVQNRTQQELLQLLSCNSEQHFLYQELLYTASLFWRFDEELLSEVISKEIPPSFFQRFCETNFVTLSDAGGWTILDPFRRWLAADLKLRSPNKYWELKNLALNTLKKRRSRAPLNQKGQITLEMIHVTQRERLLPYSWTGHSRKLEVRPIAKGDLFSKEVEPFSENYDIPSLWNADPSALIGFWSKSELAAIAIQVNEETRTILNHFPFTEYTQVRAPREIKYLISLNARLPEYDLEAAGAFFQYLMQKINEGRSISLLTTCPPLASIFCSLGFQHHQRKEAEDNRVWYLTLDLEAQDLLTCLLDNKQWGSKPLQENHSTFTALLKKLLNKYNVMEHEESLLKALRDQPLWREIDPGTPLPSFLRQKIEDSLELMANGNKEDQFYVQLITSSYIMKSDSHEMIAEKLNISLSTYYRSMKKAIDRLASVLMRSL